MVEANPGIAVARIAPCANAPSGICWCSSTTTSRPDGLARQDAADAAPLPKRPQSPARCGRSSTVRSTRGSTPAHSSAAPIGGSSPPVTRSRSPRPTTCCWTCGRSGRTRSSSQDVGIAAGEDNLFTRELTARGGRMVWCADAWVAEEVPPDRATRRWVLARSFSSANASAHNRLHQGRPAVVPGPCAGRPRWPRALLRRRGAVDGRRGDPQHEEERTRRPGRSTGCRLPVGACGYRVQRVSASIADRRASPDDTGPR